MHIEKNACESIIGTVLNIPENLVSMEELKLNGLKSHDYHALMQQLLPVAIRSVLPKHDIVVILCLLEKYFPPSIFDIMLHLTVHLRVYAECYIAEEALEFCTEYLSGMDAIGIPSSMKDEWKCGNHYLVVSDDISKKEPIEKELKWLAQGPRQQVLTYPGYIIHGCRYHIKNRDEARVNQNSGVSIVASTMANCNVIGLIARMVSKVDELGFTLVDLSKIGHKSDPFIWQRKPNKFFYVEDQVDPRWSIVLSRPKMELFDIEGDDNIADNCMEHHPFANGMPNIKFF
ncbi:hypothetical protein CK203_084925 [Vitis vinifera]|uniref:DUF4218 domain-containing protein n=1 Tax=Vitis vinifera TaxID=29760 RepID=A0A438CXE9_VITVI|nr:hypothetical protein CK203_084925 [Vitis vinifera]